MLGFALNPDAAALFAGIDRRIGLHGDGSVLFRELYVSYGAELLLSGLQRPAAYVEWLPMRIFKLRLQYDLWIWPGFALGRGHGLTFDSAQTPFDPAELQRRKGEERPGLGHRLALLPTLQAKVGPVVLIDTAELAGWFVHGPRSFWREPLHDTLIERGAVDATVKNTLLLVLQLWTGGKDTRLLFGGIHEVVHAVGADVTRHRVGPALIVTPVTEAFGVSRPTIFFLFGVNAVDRNRAGEQWMQLGLRGDLDFALEGD
jgi:hypothetical protein